MRPINFLEDKKEESINLINFNKYYLFIPILIIFILLLAFDYIKFTKEIDSLTNTLENNKLLLLDNESNSNFIYSKNDLIEFDGYFNRVEEREDKIYKIVQYIINNSNEEIYTNEINFSFNNLEINGVSSSEENIYSWLRDNPLLQLKEINYNNYTYTFTIIGEFNES